MTNYEKFIRILREADEHYGTEDVKMYECNPRQITENKFAYDFDGHLTMAIEFKGEEVLDGTTIGNQYDFEDPIVHSSLEACIEYIKNEINAGM